MLTFTENDLQQKFEVLKEAEKLTLFFLYRVGNKITSDMERYYIGECDSSQDSLLTPRMMVGLPTRNRIDCFVEKSNYKIILSEKASESEYDLHVIWDSMQTWIPAKDYLRLANIPYHNFTTIGNFLSATKNFTNLIK